MNKASGLFIPAGRIQRFQPTLQASAKSLANERNRKRGLNPTYETLNDLNKKIKKLVVEDKRTKWQSAVDKCDHRIGISHIWRLVKGLSGKQPHNSPNKGVRFADKTCLCHKLIAKKFVHHFIPPPIRLTGDKSKRQLKRKFHQLPLTGTQSFTPADTKEAIDWPSRQQPSDHTGWAPTTPRSSLKVPSTVLQTSSICQYQLDRYKKYGTKR